MAKVFVRSAYNYDTDAVSNETGLKCEDESKAQQHQKDESDINTIVRRFGLTGELPENVRIPQYGDFTGIESYHEAMNQVKEADAQFMALPAEIRGKFDNSPEKFVEFCLDEKNIDKLVEMGLAEKKEPILEPKVPAKPEPPAEAK